MSTKTSLLYKQLKLKNGTIFDVHIYNDFLNGENPSQMCIDVEGCGICIQADIREKDVEQLKNINCDITDND